MVEAWSDCVIVESSAADSVCQALAHRDAKQLRVEYSGNRALFRWVNEVCAAVVESEPVQRRVWIPCAHCEGAVRLSYAQCVVRVLGTSPTYACGLAHVPVTQLVDAVALHSLPLIDISEVQLQETTSASGTAGRLRSALFRGAQVVVKELTPRREPDSSELPELVHEAWAGFQLEVERLSTLEHANVVRVVGLLLFPPSLLMDCALVGGAVDLLGALQSHTLWGGASPASAVSTPAICSRIALDLAKGLRYLHAQRPPVTNVDLCSRNVMLLSMDAQAESVVAKIADFGLARMLCMRDVPCTDEECVAPEAEFGDALLAQPWVDLYAYAMVVNEAMTEQPPFAEYKLRGAELSRKIALIALRPTIFAHVAGWLRELLVDLWQPEASLRPPAAEVVHRLEHGGTRGAFQVRVRGAVQKYAPR